MKYYKNQSIIPLTTFTVRGTYNKVKRGSDDKI